MTIHDGRQLLCHSIKKHWQIKFYLSGFKLLLGIKIHLHGWYLVLKAVKSSQHELIMSHYKTGTYLLHLPLLLLNDLIQQGLEAILWGARDKQDLYESTCWASLSCDGFKCVSARAAHVTILSVTERPLGMPVRDSWPFRATVIITTSDEPETLPKH